MNTSASRSSEMALPARNNLKIIRYWLKRVCVWIAQKRPVYVAELPSEDVEAIDVLVASCEAVVAFIDNLYPPGS